jgi:copper chaperone CopZ
VAAGLAACTFLGVLTAGCGGGAPPPAKEPVVYDFTVEGMHCAGCERSIADAVGRLEGVEVLAVAHSNGLLRVASDGRTAAEAVTAAVEHLGYRASASARAAPD